MTKMMTGETPRTTDPRLAAIARRDAAFDGSFVYAVQTTGVYCKPSCPSRAAKPENMRFFASPGDAEAAGFRACRRCRPNEDDVAKKALLVEKACRRIEEAETPPSLDELAVEARLSSSHFQRMFKSVTGITPAAYARAARAKRMRDRLANGASVTEAMYEAGFNASSRFYEKSGDVLGMKPKSFRDGGKGERVTFAVAQSSLGSVLVAESGRGLCAILLGDDPDALVRDLQDRFPNATLEPGDDAFDTRVASVVGLVENPGTDLGLPLDLRGTAFQNRVWETLRKIPAGQTASYTEVAERIGAPQAVRAVAGACAANALAIAVPCHRVVRNDGGLSGYRWGVERKRALLDREQALQRSA